MASLPAPGSHARFSSLALLLCGLGALAGCNSAPAAPADAGPPDLTPPPAICKTPPALPGTWFTEVTAEWLPGAGGGPAAGPSASSVRAADLDGDGYPDLITTGGEGFPPRPKVGTGGRRDAAGNRPMRPSILPLGRIELTLPANLSHAKLDHTAGRVLVTLTNGQTLTLELAARDPVLLLRSSLGDVPTKALPGGGMLIWPGCLRLLDRQSPGYDL
jgi:hypothetical protein